MEAVLTVHAKGIVSDHVYVSFEDHMVVVTIDDNSGKPYVYTTRFINEIPAIFTYGAYTDYIEVRLAKSKHVDWILPDNSVDGECSKAGGETPKKVPSYSDILAKFTPPVSPCSSSPKGVGPASPICSSSPKGVGPASPVGERPAQPLTYPLLKKRQHGEIISLMDHKPPIGIRKRKKIRKRGDVSYKMRKMESDRLLKLYDDKFFAACKKPPVFCIINEYLSGGSLRAYLHQLQEPYSLHPNLVLKLAIDIARGECSIFIPRV
ncbi:hypothetical protein OROMI_008780 [Orobanche minor]